jgi:hypothetical protein
MAGDLLFLHPFHDASLIFFSISTFLGNAGSVRPAAAGLSRSARWNLRTEPAKRNHRLGLAID